jgi:hypothetical protein
METLAVAILLLLILRVVFYAARIPFLWYLTAGLLFFSGSIGPGLGCLLLGMLMTLASLARSH